MRKSFQHSKPTFSSKKIRKNVSKKDADKQRKVATYNKNIRRQVKVNDRQQEFELRQLAKKKDLN